MGVDGFFTDFPGTGREVIVNDYLAGTGYANPNNNLNSPYLPDPNQPYYGDLVVANLNRSQGFEGMAFSPDRSTLYPLLEGTVVGDPVRSLRIYEFDVASSEYEGLLGYYRLESATHAIGDFTPINDNEFLVIERDNLQAGAAAFKKIFKVNFSQLDEKQFVSKEEVVDLLSIEDPNDLNGDGSTTYTMPFQTIEDVIVLDNDTILVANDNNYPFSIGRPTAIDNNEIVILQLDEPLALDARLGVQAAQDAAPELSTGTPGGDTAIANDPTSTVEVDGINDLIFTGAGADEVDTSFVNSPFAGNNRIFTGSGSDIITVNEGDRAFGGSGADIFEATDAESYRLSGGTGDDQFFLGVGGRALGGDGNDTFYVGEGGDNLLSGGAGADAFWLTSGELPTSANTIVDFTLGTDLLGLIGYTFADLSFNGSDILLGGETIATLVGVNAETLTVANFA